MYTTFMLVLEIFNEETAKNYTDMALLTADRKIGKEVLEVFSVLENNFFKARV